MGIERVSMNGRRRVQGCRAKKLKKCLFAKYRCVKRDKCKRFVDSCVASLEIVLSKPKLDSDQGTGNFPHRGNLQETIGPGCQDAVCVLLKLAVRPGGDTRPERQLDFARVYHISGQGFCAEVLPEGLDR